MTVAVGRVGDEAKRPAGSLFRGSNWMGFYGATAERVKRPQSHRDSVDGKSSKSHEDEIREGSEEVNGHFFRLDDRCFQKGR